MLVQNIMLKFCNTSKIFGKEIINTLLAGIDAFQMHLLDVYYSVSETSQRGLICKSLRLLPGDWLKTSSQRCIWNLSGFLSDVFEFHLRLQFFALKLCHFLATCLSTYKSLSVLLNKYRKLLRPRYKLEIYLGY